MKTDDIYITVTENELIQRFIHYCDLYFDNSLPLPEFRLVDRYRTVGYFSCRYDKYGCYNPVIEVSSAYDYTEKQLDEIIVHEMIHFKLAFDGVDMKVSHGKAFMDMARKISAKSGLDIVKSGNSMAYKVRDGKSKFVQAIATLF